MGNFLRRSRIQSAPETVFDWHGRPGALERLIPPWDPIEVLRLQGGATQEGARSFLRVRIGPFSYRWIVLHHGGALKREFTTEQTQGPFAAWRHTHRFLREAGGPQGTCLLEDELDYILPGGMPEEGLTGRWLRKRLARTFTFRHERIQNDIYWHGRFAEKARLKVAVTGSSGLIGRRLCAFLTAGGHSVVRLVRRPADLAEDAALWNPATGEIAGAAMQGVAAIVHLAGENIAQGRWTRGRMAALRKSRVEATQLLCQWLARNPDRPRVMVCASAVGYYGHRGDAQVTENDHSGEGFLAGLCREWEAAAEPAKRAGIRVAHLRTGLVVAGEGGALGKMLLPFRLGMGGVLGSGAQGISWIAMEDLTGILYQALFDDRFRGPINAVAPRPVSNREFTHTLARVLGRPAVLRVPGAALRLRYGRMANELLLKGVFAVPGRLQTLEFPYLYPELEAALRAELGAYREG
jgi:uncharacterized protein (TIGR01777 family)